MNLRSFKIVDMVSIAGREGTNLVVEVPPDGLGSTTKFLSTKDRSGIWEITGIAHY